MVRLSARAARVSGPATPSGSSRARRWKPTTASRVCGPKWPSSVPGSRPCTARRYWSTETSSPTIPRLIGRVPYSGRPSRPSAFRVEASAVPVGGQLRLPLQRADRADGGVAGDPVDAPGVEALCRKGDLQARDLRIGGGSGWWGNESKRCRERDDPPAHAPDFRATGVTSFLRVRRERTPEPRRPARPPPR